MIRLYLGELHTALLSMGQNFQTLIIDVTAIILLYTTDEKHLML